jgi:hypothetical protein
MVTPGRRRGTNAAHACGDDPASWASLGDLTDVGPAGWLVGSLVGLIGWWLWHRRTDADHASRLRATASGFRTLWPGERGERGDGRRRRPLGSALRQSLGGRGVLVRRTRP